MPGMDWIGFLALVALSTFLAQRARRSQRTARLPGPPRVPFPGSRLPSPREPIAELLARYSKKYGTSHFIMVPAVLDDPADSLSRSCLQLSPVHYGNRDREHDRSGEGHVRDALQHLFRQKSTEDGRAVRLNMLFLLQLQGWGFLTCGNSAGMSEGLLFQPDAAQLRQGRKFLALGLQPNPLKAYQPTVYKHVVTFLTRLLAEPDNFRSAVSMYVARSPSEAVFHAGVAYYNAIRLPTGVALDITYGHQVTGEDDLFLQRAQLAIKRFSNSVVLSFKDGFIVNWIPICASWIFFSICAFMRRPACSQCRTCRAFCLGCLSKASQLNGIGGPGNLLLRTSIGSRTM